MGGGRDVSIADARLHLQIFFAKVLKICIAVTQQLVNPAWISITGTFASHNCSNNLVVI